MVPSPPPVDVPRDIVVGQKRHTWTRQTLQEAERHVVPRGTFKENKRPRRYLCYATAMSHIIGSKIPIMKRHIVIQYGEMP